MNDKSEITFERRSIAAYRRINMAVEDVETWMRGFRPVWGYSRWSPSVEDVETAERLAAAIESALPSGDAQ